jgi:hypothetical protein
VTNLTLDRLRTEGQSFMEELSREYYLAGSGLKPTAELQPIYDRHAQIIGPDALHLVREEMARAPAASDERRAARMLLEWLAELQSSRELAPLEEREIGWESSAVVRLEGREIEYQQTAIVVANTTDRRERLRIEKARNMLVATGLAPLRRERLERERTILNALHLGPSYDAAFEAVSGIALDHLAAQCEELLESTEAIWEDTFPRFVRKILNIEPRDATRADAAALFRAHEFDEQFPESSMEWEIRRQVREMGIDPIAGGRVVYDTEARPGKRARAFCAPVRVPDEVYLVLRPHGGQADWSTFLHELGHALHFAYTNRDLPFEYRWLGDNSVTEGYAMLFDHMLHDVGWLKRYTPLSAARLDAFTRSTAFHELHMLRRYAAKLLYERELHGGHVLFDRLPERYVGRLTSATSFRYDPADAFVDVDPRYYAARYLRAWQLQALLQETLTERYNPDWWRNPRAGPWVMGQLFAEGQRELAQELAARVAKTELGFGPLVRAIENALA